MPGASGFFVPRLADPRQVERVVREVPLPLNLIAFPGAPPKAEWAAAGVARISHGPVPAPRADGAADRGGAGGHRLSLLTARFGKPGRGRCRTPWPAKERMPMTDNLFERFADAACPGRPAHPVQRWDAGSAQAVAKVGCQGDRHRQRVGGHGQWLRRWRAGADRLRARQCRRIVDGGRAARDGRLRRRLFGRPGRRRRAISRGWQRPARSAAISRTRSSAAKGFTRSPVQAERIAAARAAVGPDFFINVPDRPVPEGAAGNP